jgi:hypothetical protein
MQKKRSDWLWTFAIYFGADFSSDQNFVLKRNFLKGHRGAADQTQTSWEKLVQYVGTNYGQDISNELQNKIPMTLAEPVHTPEVLARHAI